MTFAQIAATLRTTEKNAPARIIGMRIGIACTRCGGSGRYSFNQIDGSRCWGCKGRQCILPSNAAELAEVAERATAAAYDGTLDKYVARMEAAARCKNGKDRAFAAWKAMDKLNGYGPNWSKLDTLPNRDEVVANNKVGVDLINALNKLEKAKAVDWVEYDRVLTAGLAELERITKELETAK